MKVINFAETNSLISQYMTELRDTTLQADMLRFRHNLQRIGEIMAYEISKTVDYKSIDIKTPLAEMKSEIIDSPIVLATIFRAGLPFHQGFLNYFDHAENAFVSAYRKYKEKENFDICIVPRHSSLGRQNARDCRPDARHRCIYGTELQGTYH